MGFYFCSGIFLCFMCVITLPIFSTGKPCSDEETSNNKSNQIDVEELFKKRNEIDDDEFEALTEKNEKENPISFYYGQLMSHKYENQELKDDDVNILQIKEFVEKQYASHEGYDSDEEEANIGAISYFIFGNYYFCLKPKEDAFYEQLRAGDKKNNGTVSKEYAKEVILRCELFNGRLKDDKLDDLLNKYTNQDNEFNYNDMKKNIINDYKGDKSFFMCYDNEKNDWLPKFAK
ncbi:uncharacterized protein LOC126895003 isoform X1 [Daktulosphaira vitifoliae]|uniref:uncharacterized protein LOC126895003 isoform X1 n=1 Tax=Daktulosphaira vitifoliae TaxID=58002 RepID=UPI0021AA792B|nr:uncharacterized protein LOC126895003 isoform X1 [Daktulosphaira vitifoliae]